MQNMIYTLDSANSRGLLTEVHIADIHFGVIDPLVHYQILAEQFLNKISRLNFDILSIDGDLFDHKYMSNSDVILYAIKFIDNCVEICKAKNATLVILHGTKSHDADQLKLFYHYIDDRSIDIRIVENTRFEYIKNVRVLCIPEEYGKGAEYYYQFLYHSGQYDTVYMHGTIKGSIYGANKVDLNAEKPVFDLNCFGNCLGPIIAGHVHTGGCFDRHMYYTSSPIRYKYGEEEPKGFLVIVHNLDTHEYYPHFEEIKSFRYDTINLDHMLNDDPKNVVSYLKQLQASGIDNIRVEFTSTDNIQNIELLKNYFRNDSSIKIDADNISVVNALNQNKEIVDKYSDMGFLLDPSLSPDKKFVQYVNYKEGYEFITVDKLIEILKSC